MSTLIEDQADIVKGIYRNYTNRPDSEKLRLLLNAVLRFGIMAGKEAMYQSMRKSEEQKRNYSRKARQKSQKRLAELELKDGEDERIYECENAQEALKKRDRMRSYARYHDIPVNVFMDRKTVIVERKEVLK